MYNYGGGSCCSTPCYPTYAYPIQPTNNNSSFAIILVLFILLVVVLGSRYAR